MKTSTLRFVTVRNHEPAHPAFYALPFDPATLQTKPDYGQSLYKKLDDVQKNAALKPAEKIEEIKDAVEAFKSSASFISNAKQFDELYPGFVEFRDWIIKRRRLTVEDIYREADRVLHLSARKTLPTARLLNLTDNLIAYVIADGDQLLREKISLVLRMNNVVQKAEKVRGAADLRKLIAAPVILPDVVVLPVVREEKQPDRGPQEDPAVTERKRNWEKLNQLTTAHEELTEARAMQIETATEPARKAQTAGFFSRLLSSILRLPPEQPEPLQVSFTAQGLRSEHMAAMSPQTRDVLSELQIKEGTTFTDALSKVERRAQDIAAQIGASISPYTEQVLIGNTLVNRRFLPDRDLEAGPAPEGPEIFADGVCEFKFPFKIADLRVVEQELKDYLAGEVAHVENILQGELKERSTRRLKRTEETLFTSEEREETNEKDTQTTNRFQLEQEISKTVKKDSELQVNAKVDTQYYGYVNVQGSASAGYAAHNSEEQSTRDAVNYAKDVVERAAQKVIQRIKDERTLKTTEEFEETNRHVLNNIGGQHHIVGVYRWLDQEYTVWLKNYGKRLMFELFIPEPGAYHIYAMTQKKDSTTVGLNEPKAPNDADYAKELGVPGFALTSHKDITPFNYPIWAAAYGAEVTPPPPAYQTIATGMGMTTDPQDFVLYTEKSDSALTVPNGWVAQSCRVQMDWDAVNGWGTSRIGLHVFGMNDNGITYNMDGETGAIPTMLHVFNRRAVAHFEVVCIPLPGTIEEWKIKTYKAIISAYESKKAAYENAVAEARAGAGVVIRGTNPLFNKTIIETELKKNAIKLMTHCNPLYSSAMRGTEGGFDCCQVLRESPYIEFVEQVFEWRNMVYEFYPYHWADKTHWTKLYNLSDTDPLFQNFLQAGYARILVPVTPGYDQAALNFVHLGKPDLHDLASLQVMDIINGMDEDAPTLAPARVSTQSNIDLLNPPAAIDGVALVAGDRVLVRNQTAEAENGVYIWNGSGVALTRATDADDPTELSQAVIEVTEGTDKGFKFRQTELPLNTIGTDPIIFRIAAEIINESLLIPTELTILECQSAGVEPTTMKILGLCQTVGTMTPVLGVGSQPGGTEDSGGH